MKSKEKTIDRTLSVAPMLDWMDFNAFTGFQRFKGAYRGTVKMSLIFRYPFS
ncbi:hypothetical protein [uncultured Shewanella sp.]|uniref:hypothetical protein n=1 Tax=uncultured Shewanella sp. TaxID=173975 RepID=UPI0026281672|nr:hypothetical protein [uncultured Shewanella sp.]